MDQISTAKIVDVTVLSVVLLLGVAGFWRGVAKELFISAAALLGYAVATQWAVRWGEWAGDHTRLTVNKATFVVFGVTIATVTIVIGYVGCAMAGLPPADAPGRIGGFVAGVTNGVFLVAVILTQARSLVLGADRIATLRSTEIASRLSANVDWIMLASTLVALAEVIAAWQVRRKRLLIVTAGTGPRQGKSGFSFRRKSPLAPEAEKIERHGSHASSWSVPAAYAETTALTRVSDPSGRNDRPALDAQNVDTSPAPWQTDEVVRCISCGARITEHDRYCPRCGRQLT